MINYNPKEWFTFIFRLHKAETLVKLKWMLLSIAIYASLVVFIEQNIFHVVKANHINNIIALHSMLGFVISLLLVFRTNTAYDRWWEGRKLWGALVNNSRNLAMKLSSIIDDNTVKTHFHFLIQNYAFSLKNHLRGEFKPDELLYDEVFTVNTLKHNQHIPNQIASIIYMEIENLRKTNKIDSTQVLFLNSEIQSFTDICGACERIRNTPILFSYSVFLKKFIY